MFFGWFTTITFVGIPYLSLTVIIELLKLIFTEVSWFTMVWFVVATLFTFFVAFFWKKGKSFCFNKVRTHLLKRRRNKIIESGCEMVAAEKIADPMISGKRQ